MNGTAISKKGRSKPSWGQGLLVRMFVPAAIVVLLAVGSMKLLENTVIDRRQDVVMQQRGDVRLEGMVQRLDRSRRAAQALARTIAATPGVAGAAETGNANRLTRLLEGAAPAMYGALVFDATGAELARSGSETLTAPIETVAAQVLAVGAGGYVRSNPAGVSVLGSSIVETAAGEVGMVIVHTVLDGPSLRANSGYDAVDTAVFDHGNLLQTSMQAPAVREAMALPGATLDTLDAMNQRLRPLHYHATGYQLANGEWMAALVPTHDLDAVQERFNQMLAMVAIVLTVGLLVVLFLQARYVSNSIASVVAATAEVANGNYKRRVSPSPVRELAQLGNAVNNMASQMQERLGELEHRAFHDPLTTLPNRALFIDRIDQCLRRGARSGTTMAVLFVDLDDFKVVNDTLGHAAGDELLIKVSDVLRKCTRPGDTIARLGGDEFSLLLEDLVDHEYAVSVAERVLYALREPMRLNGRYVVARCSIGIAPGVAGAISSAALVQNADMAMYKAKREGKGRYAVFSPDMSQAAWERLQMEPELQRALKESQLRLYYQPVVNLQDGAIVGAEALMRWEHPERGLLGPDDFIDIAEETGLIVPMEQWAHREASRQLRLWQRVLGRKDNFVMNINVSPRQFMQPGLADRIFESAAALDVDPHQLTLEITEKAAVSAAEVNVENLRRLRERGFNLAIDDFGVGHSALRYFKEFPVNAVKIDRSFVSGLGVDRTDTAIVHAMVGFAKALDLRVTAEGVENVRQMAQLQSLGIQMAQGYLFGRPNTHEHLEALLRAGRAPNWAADTKLAAAYGLRSKGPKLLPAV